MNCTLCRQKRDSYSEGTLTEDTRIQVEDHLKTCKDCEEVFQIENLTNNVILDEISIQSNPYLVTRIMAGIDIQAQKPAFDWFPLYNKVVKPALLVVSLGAAVMTGILAGNMYKPSVFQIPAEMTLINDASIESLELLSKE